MENKRDLVYNAVKRIYETPTYSIDLHQILDLLMDQLKRIFKPDGGSVVLYDEKTGRLRSSVYYNIGETILREAYYELGEGYIGMVGQSRKCLLVPDVDQENHFGPKYRNTGVNRLVKSFLGAPMTVETELIGVLETRSRKVDNFDENDRELLKILADSAAVAIKNNIISRTLGTLWKIDEAICTKQKLDDILESILLKALDLVGAYAGYIYLIDKSANELLLVAASSPCKGIVPKREKIGEGPFSEVIDTGDPKITPNLAKTPYFRKLAKRYENTCSKIPEYGEYFRIVKSEMIVPLKEQENVIGVFAMQSRTVDFFTQNKIEIAKNMAKKAGLAKENARMLADSDLEHRRMDIIYEIARDISYVLDPNSIFEEIMDRSLEILNADRGFFILKDEMGNWNSRAARGLTEDSRLPDIKRGQGLTGWVAKHGRPYLCPDVSKDHKYFSIWPNIQSELVVPVISERETIGVLNIESKRIRAFDQEDEHLLTALAGVVGLSIKNAQLHSKTYKALQIRTQELDSLCKISQMLSNPPGVMSVLNEIMDHSLRLTDTDIGFIALVSKNTKELDIPVLREIRKEKMPRLRLGEGGIVAHVIKEKDSYFSNNVDKDPYYIDARDDVKSEIAVPLIYEEKVIGVLDVESVDYYAFSKDDVEILTAFAAQVASVIGRANNAKQMESLLGVVKTIAEVADHKEILDAVVKEITRVMDYKACFLRCLRNGNELVVGASFGLSKKYGPEFSIRVGEGVSGRTAQYRKAIAVRNVLDNPWYKFPEIAKKEKLAGFLCVPLVFADELIGTLNCYVGEPYRFPKGEKELVNTFGSLVAGVIKHAENRDTMMARMEAARRLNKIGNELAENLELNRILKTIVKGSVWLTNATHGYIALKRGETGELNIVYPKGLESKIKKPRMGKGIIGRVAYTGRSYLCPDASRDDLYVQCWKSTRSELCVPLGYGGKVMGVINVESDQIAAFSETQQELLCTFARYAASIYQNARLLAQSEVKLSQMEMLDKIGKQLISIHDTNTLLQSIVGIVAETFMGNVCTVYLYEPDVKRLILRAAVGFPEELIAPIGSSYDLKKVANYRIGEGLTGSVALDKRAIAIPDVKRDSRRKGKYAKRIDLEKDVDILAFLGAPIWKDKELLGVATITRVRRSLDDDKDFAEEDKYLIDALVSQIVIALENIQLIERQEKSVSNIRGLLRAVKDVTGSVDTRRILQHIVETGVQLLGEDVALDILLSSTEDKIVCEIWHGKDYEEILKGKAVVDAKKRLTPPKGKGISYWVFRKEESKYVPDVSKDSVYHKVLSSTQSEYAIPLLHGGNLIGVLNAESNKVAAFTDERRSLLDTLAGFAAVAIGKSKTLVESMRSLHHGSARHLSSIEENVKRLMSTSDSPVLNKILRRTRLIRSLMIAQKDVYRNVALGSEITSSYHEVNLAEEITKICSLLQEEEVQVKIRPMDTTYSVYANTEAIVCLFSCIIYNAIKFTKASSSKVKMVVIRLKYEKDFIRVVVADNGVGIPEEEQKYVKDFGYIGKEHRRLASSGMGLWLVEQIVKAHQGKLEIKSKDRKGTKVYVSLPKFSESEK